LYGLGADCSVQHKQQRVIWEYFRIHSHRWEGASHDAG
jgi:hypothetical protein